MSKTSIPITHGQHLKVLDELIETQKELAKTRTELIKAYQTNQKYLKQLSDIGRCYSKF